MIAFLWSGYVLLDFVFLGRFLIGWRNLASLVTFLRRFQRFRMDQGWVQVVHRRTTFLVFRLIGPTVIRLSSIWQFVILDQERFVTGSVEFVLVLSRLFLTVWRFYVAILHYLTLRPRLIHKLHGLDHDIELFLLSILVLV